MNILIDVENKIFVVYRFEVDQDMMPKKRTIS